jgi:two-component system LytT family sensor kinase
MQVLPIPTRGYVTRPIAVLLAAACTTLALRRYGSREQRRLAARVAELDAALCRARLHEHRSRISPHLLLNALNSVAVLAEQEGAVRVQDATTRLARLMRSTLEQQAPLTTLSREIAFLDGYVAVERVRFGEQLSVEWQIAEDCLDAQVPTLMLQPIVENAVRHGISPATGAANVTIGAARDGRRLRVWVADRGPGLNGHSRRGGRGLSITRQQLELLFADRYTLELASGRGSGVVVTLTLPLLLNGAHHADTNTAGG